MASISQLNQFPCKSLAKKPPTNTELSSIHNSIRLNPISPYKSRVLMANTTNERPTFIVRAVDDDKWGAEKKDEGGDVTLVEEEKPKEETEIDDLKKQLVDLFHGTDRGLRATSETRAEIVEVITQLEAKNPTPAPTEALPLLNGKWILAYTSFSGLFPLLSRGTLPLLKVEEISQTIDSESFTVQNSVQFSGPLATTSISTSAKFKV